MLVGGKDNEGWVIVASGGSMAAQKVSLFPPPICGHTEKEAV